jgi:hypothetical protein
LFDTHGIQFFGKFYFLIFFPQLYFTVQELRALTFLFECSKYILGLNIFFTINNQHKKANFPQITINKGILVNKANFIIKINTIYHFLKNRAQTLKDYYFKTEGVFYFISSLQLVRIFSYKI